MITIGSLCSGVGGLDLAVESFFDARVEWVAENDPDPSLVLERHWPGVMNLGDVTSVDWSLVPRVDVLTGGTPCQDLSTAGRMAGFMPGTRSNLWVAMRDAIAILRPKVVVWENVRGALHARADSKVESEPGLLGVGTARPALRAIGRVLGDLAQLGFDAEWAGVRASDVGAPHQRFRLFVIAYNPGVRRDFRSVGEPEGARVRSADRRWPAGAVNLLPTLVAAEGEKASGRQNILERVGAGQLWLTNVINDMQRVEGSWKTEAGVDYGPAIARWEETLGRPAPAPTLPDGANGNHRLSARFAEWMMGLPDGWVTDPDLELSRNEQLRACGNAVVPQQAFRALELLWDRIEDAA